ncbi:neurotrimin-like isoform X2 [Brevipalpus obovatus]|uniref:neurotrimin-like isoform X2 n=1 Tax=Brevipalpus obovatus TaxID=246614 RepID=UPI003D9E8B58
MKVSTYFPSPLYALLFLTTFYAITSTAIINSQTDATTDGLAPIDFITDTQKVDEDENSSKPEFVNKVPSLSITRGKDAVMRCTVKNLGNNVISWHHLESNSDLTINKQVLKSDPRIRIKQEQDSWLLIINNVSLEDKGFYVCRINWQPNSQLAYLNVVVPPKFDENSFPNNHEIVIQEYINLTLRCQATGDPQPTIEWRHEDGGPIVLSTPTDLTTSLASSSPRRIEGEELHFRPITRWSMGSYLCIASNGVPPSISRRLMITVHFPPVIRIAQQSLVVMRGQNAVLQCLVESCPLAEQQWIHPNGEVINEEWKKYSLDTEETYHFKVVHQLTIKNAEIEDGGEFICVVNNSIGEAKSSIKLQE